MPVPFLDLTAQYRTLQQELRPAVNDVLASGRYALGPAVEEFERAFARTCGVQHCIGVASGTSALILLLRAKGVGPGDEVITVPNSFFATVEAIALVGATPVFVDVREETALMDTAKITAAVTEQTKAIIPVHLYGQCADVAAIRAITDPRGILCIEDACQAHGALARERPAGSLGHAAAFSFYPGKNLGAYGEAGAVTTDDAALASCIRSLRDHGQSQKYHHNLVGSNERMDGIQGAVLGVKLTHLDAWNVKRREHEQYYRKLLDGAGDVRFIEVREGNEHVHHLFVIRTDRRDELQSHLRTRGIETGIHYPIPIHLQDAAKQWGYQEGTFPVTERLAGEILSLPMYPELREEDIEEVCRATREFFT